MPDYAFAATATSPSSSGKELLNLLAAELERLEEANLFLRNQLTEQGLLEFTSGTNAAGDPIMPLGDADGVKFMEPEFLSVHPLAPPSPAWQDLDPSCVAPPDDTRYHGQRRNGRCIFDDGEDLKRELTEQFAKKRRTTNAIADATSRLNWIETESFASKLVTSRQFEIASFVIIVCNAVWIAIDADFNQATVITEAAWYFQVVEHTFCTCFLIEWCLWLAAFRQKSVMLLNSWCLFDTIIVVSMIIETWVVPSVVTILGGSTVLDLDATVFRLLRLTRLARISRMMRILPEMVFMLKGLAKATRTVSCTLVLLLVVVYTFGVVLRQLSDGTSMGDTYFRSVPDAVYTCLLAGTLLDEVREVMDDIRAESASCAILFGCVIMFSALTMMNMLVGVLCDVIGNVASTEKEAMLVNHVRRQVQSVLDEIDCDNDGKVSKEEFRAILRAPVAVKALQEVGVDVMALVDSAELIFQSDDEGNKFDKSLTFNDFMSVVLQLRGANPATVRDVMDLRKFVHTQNNARYSMLTHLDRLVRKLAYSQDQLMHHLKVEANSCSSFHKVGNSPINGRRLMRSPTCPEL